MAPTTAPIANHTALQMTTAGKAVLVDVREPAEFGEGHLPGAMNLPSTQFRVEAYEQFADRPIFLVCQSGNRANAIRQKLARQGIGNVRLLATQMEALTAAQSVVAPPSGWGIDRQFRLTLGLLLALFLLGYWLASSPFFFVIPGVMCAGLLYSAVTDRCYLRVGIARMPWNQRRDGQTHVTAGPHARNMPTKPLPAMNSAP